MDNVEATRLIEALERIAVTLEQIAKTQIESKTIQSMRDVREATHHELPGN